ncbi:MAG TPA: hypothetical protein VGM93_12685 [Acidimicrobiales bacterium]
MRTRITALAVLIAVAAFAAGCSSGCSNDDKQAGSNGPDTSATTVALGGASSNGSPSSNPSGGGGKVDCDAIKAAQPELISLQLLAQLKDPDTIQQIKSHTIGNLDLDKFLAAMKTLHALDGAKGVFGDPKAAIDIYEKAATDAKALFAADPPTQAAIDAYDRSIGTPDEFLGHQTAIAGALGADGC